MAPLVRNTAHPSSGIFWLRRRDECHGTAADPENPACHRGSPLRQVQAVEREVTRIESSIAETVANDETTRSEAAITESISGVGQLTAELLAIRFRSCVAWIPSGSRRRQTWRRILWRAGSRRGRRSSAEAVLRVRILFYIFNCNVSKYSPVIGGLYSRMVKRGKTFRQARTVCMQGLLPLICTLEARGRVGSPSRAI
jgi:hypothetical protein